MKFKKYENELNEVIANEKRKQKKQTDSLEERLVSIRREKRRMR